MGRFRYTFDVLTNRKTFRDLKESSPLRKLLETVRSVLSEGYTWKDEVIGTGNDDENTQFTGFLKHPELKPGSLIITAQVGASPDVYETFTDQGDGTLQSDGSPPGTGTINYETGAFDVTFSAPPLYEKDVLATYVGFLPDCTTGLNALYDARFIQYACGDDLDKWGETLGLPRPTTGEPPQYVDDEVYRADLLAELRDFTKSLTAEAIKDAVEGVMGTGKRPEIKELYTLAPDWPIGWDDVDAPYTTWVPWDGLVDFLVVLAPTDIDDEPIATGGGGQTYFEGYLDHPPVKRKTVLITDGVETFTDDGDGTLTSDATPDPGTGTIDYVTGHFTLNFKNPPGDGVPIYADYTSLADPEESQLSQLNDALILVKFAPAKALVTDDSGGDYYILRKEVG